MAILTEIDEVCVLPDRSFHLRKEPDITMPSFINISQNLFEIIDIKTHTQTDRQTDTNRPKYTMTVKQIYGERCMDRQISESIQINNIPNRDRINNKVDYQQNKIPRTMFSWE